MYSITCCNTVTLILGLIWKKGQKAQIGSKNMKKWRKEEYDFNSDTLKKGENIYYNITQPFNFESIQQL